MFFEVFVKLPSDFQSEVPGIPEEWLDELFAANRPLPEESDMLQEDIEDVYVELAERIVNQMRLEWDYRVGKGRYKDFFQLEQKDDAFHMHCLLETMNVKGFVFGRFIKSFKERIANRVYAGHPPAGEEWFRPRVYVEGVAKTNQTVGDSYIYNYLLPKRQKELQWAWSSIEEFQPALLNQAERGRIVSEYLAQRAEERVERHAEDPSSANPRVRTKNAETYMGLVNWLVERGITSEKEWIREDQNSYLTYNAGSSSRAQIKAALDNAAKIMTLTKTAVDYLVGKHPPEDVSTNRVYRIFEMNGYDPQLAGSILYGWANRQFGKRNAIWLYGPATTGKTNIAEAIAHAVPFYGCVNWTNENFPFNDCVDKMLVWWEEGKMTAKIVESAKSILGGSKVRVDQKCKSSQQIDSTPVIITSNTDMTIVVDGNSTTMEHREPLEDRMFMFYLGKRLPNDFGKISKEEVRCFFKWAELNRTEVPHVFRVPTVRPGSVYKDGASAPSSLSTEDARGEEPPAKRSRYEGSETLGGERSEEISPLERWLAGGDRPVPCVVHDHQDVPNEDAVFDLTVRECPDSNKEQ